MRKTIQALIETEALEFSYGPAAVPVLRQISLSIGRGEFVAIAGRNGSGKSTLAHLLNALLLPTSGAVRINGSDTRDISQHREIRRQIGMLFQCPDNQIIGTTVLEDVAFGLENLGIAPELIGQKARQALKTVALEDQAGYPPDTLSASQKQQLCIAAILAMEPAGLILDESTAMLDHSGKTAIMALLRRLNRESGLTVLHCTHDMEEAVRADRVIVLDQGMIRFDGTPAELLAAPLTLHDLGLEPPPVAKLLELLRQDGLELPQGIVSAEDAVASLATFLDSVHHDADPV